MMKMVSAREYERKKPIFPRIFDEPRMPKTVPRVSLTKREEDICLRIIKIAVYDAMDCILRHRSKVGLAEILEVVQNRMINCLLRLDFPGLADKPKLERMK
jgi:hypothetical protein